MPEVDPRAEDYNVDIGWHGPVSKEPTNRDVPWIALQVPAHADIGPTIVLGATDHDLEGLTRPLLEALATLGDLDSTYLVVFDRARREHEVRFVHSVGEVSITKEADLRFRIPCRTRACPE